MPSGSRRPSKEGRASYAGNDLIEVVVRPKKYYRVSTAGQSDNRDKIVVDEDETRRIIKNVLVLSLSMMIQYVAYQGTLNLQSSLNAEDGLGTIALSAIYLSLGASCLVLPTLMIHRLTCKWTLIVGQICFIPYIGLQLHSRFYTLVPAGILLGIAAAPMWAAQATYLTQISQIYAILKKAEVDAVITLFFGIFFFAWQNADSIGNAFSSIEIPLVLLCNHTHTLLQQGNYRNQDKYEKLARELAAERGRLDDIEFAKMQAQLASQRIKDTAEASDGEDDELEDDVTVTKSEKRKPKKKA